MIRRPFIIRGIMTMILVVVPLISSPSHAAATTPRAPACPEIKAGPVAWVTLNDGRIEKQVDAYPSDTSYIAAAFEVNCMPKNVTLTVVWTAEGDTIFSRKFTPKPLLSRGRIMEMVGMTDESPLGEGKYGVKFLLDKKVLTQGEVMVGGGD
jgi:hypothetical protein